MKDRVKKTEAHSKVDPTNSENAEEGNHMKNAEKKPPLKLSLKDRVKKITPIQADKRANRKQATQEQLNNPLHGVKLKDLLERLVDYYGWEYLAVRVNIRCFKYNPTMKSSLGFLRKTRWARNHVEDVYLDMLEEIKDN